MNRSALLACLVVSTALLGCGQSTPPSTGATAQDPGSVLQIGGVGLGRPLGGSPLAERLKKENPAVGPQGELIAGAPILFSRVQVDASKNVEALYVRFDEEEYDNVKRALAEKFLFECKAGKAKDKRGKEVEDEICVYTGPVGSVALRRRDQRLDISSAGLFSPSLGKPSLDDPFPDHEQPRTHKGS